MGPLSKEEFGEVSYRIWAFYGYNSSTLCMGNTIQDPWWMPEIMDGTEPFLYCVFYYVYVRVSNHSVMSDSLRLHGL